MTTNIEDVQAFWDKNPLFVGEIEHEPGTEEWFKSCDEIRIRDIFAGDLSDWISEKLRGKKMLDVGCGPGFWNRVSDSLGVDYHGIDISPKSVELAKASQTIFELEGAISVGNAESLDFPEESFDYVLSEGVIHHTPDTQKCIDEIYRVLRNGGYATVSVYRRGLLLQSKVLFKALLLLMKVMRISLKGRGREKMYNVTSPEELVRIYDGRDNPVGKAYTERELIDMFHSFSNIRFKRYYIPTRAIGIHLPMFLQRSLASLFGLLVLVKAHK